MNLVCFKTSIPFGIETNQNSTFIKVKLNEELKDIILNLENQLDKDKIKVSAITSRKNFDLLKIKIKKIKNILNYKISYNNQYLKTLNEIDKNDILDIKFSINQPFTYHYQNKIYTGLSIYLDEIILH